MSTKVTIKCRTQGAGSPGFHLYSDVLDSLGSEDAGESLVYLCLEGVKATLQTVDGGGASVTVALPREVARDLGLLPRVVGRETEAGFKAINREMSGLGLSYQPALLSAPSVLTGQDP